MAPPPGPRFLIVVYPHTSNWDFLWGILFRFACGWPIAWIGKDSLFRGPWGRVLKAWGGIPVDRARPAGFVEGLVDEYRRRESLIIGIAPEGTRSAVKGWKSGFYRLATAAGVPIALGSIDYATRRVGVRGYVNLTGDADADMAAIAAGYAGCRGFRPERAGPIVLGNR